MRVPWINFVLELFQGYLKSKVTLEGLKSKARWSGRHYDAEFVAGWRHHFVKRNAVRKRKIVGPKEVPVARIERLRNPGSELVGRNRFIAPRGAARSP